MADALIGKTLGHYKVLESLGEGGMGEVFRARDQTLGREIAIKLLSGEIASNPALRERFRREARTLAALNHPNIVMVFSVEEVDGLNFMTMELVDGSTISRDLPENGYELERILHVAIPIVDALAEAHQRGVVHRDLKPGNIVVDADGRVKVLDFGLATYREGDDEDPDSEDTTAGLTSDGLVVGTVPYMSPEQVEGKALDRRSDIFSFGTLLFELATGRRPFSADSKFGTMLAISKDKPPPIATWRPDLPRRLEVIIHRCLQKRPSRRYQHACEVKRDLETLREILDSETTETETATAHLPARPEDAGPVSSTSVAVLPFDSLSAESDDQYFGDGLAEELINVLSRIEGLDVPARTSSFRFRGGDRDIRQIGRQLGVSTVLEGSVRRSGDRVRISAQLISVADGYHLWSSTYDRDLDDIFAIQDEVARAIAEELKVEIHRDMDAGPIRRYTDNRLAYETYLKGRYFWLRRDQHGMQKAHELFEQALTIDPDYALARVGLADVYWTLAVYVLAPPRTLHARARDEATRALELDESLAEAHVSLAALDMIQANWESAERGYRHAIELRPNYAYAHAYYAVLLSMQLRVAEMEEQLRIATRAEPLSQYIFGLAASAHYMAQRYEEAAAYATTALELDPGSTIGLWCLGLSRSALGQHAEAIEVLQLAHDVAGTPSITGLLAYGHGRAGNHDRALEILSSAQKRIGDDLRPYYFFGVQLGLGNRDEAHDQLERGLEAGVPSQWFCMFGRPFPDLVERMGMPPGPRA